MNDREKTDKLLSQWLMRTSDELRITRLDRTDLLDAVVALLAEARAERDAANARADQMKEIARADAKDADAMRAENARLRAAIDPSCMHQCAECYAKVREALAGESGGPQDMRESKK